MDTCAVNPTKLSFEFRVVIGTIQYTPWKGIVPYFSISNDHVCVVLFQNGRKFWCFLFGQIGNMMEWRSQYTLSFYRGSQDGKTIRFTWKSYRSHSWGKRETGLPDQKMNVNHLHGSSLKEHVQHGSWKTETKNAYVEVT